MKQLIAVVGMAGSGKSIVTEYLEKKGWERIYFGGVIYDKMKEEQIPITPESQKEFRENLRKEHGMGVVAKILLPQIEKAYQKGNTVLDGLYSWDEYLILKEKFQENLKLVCVVCEKTLRYQRIGTRKERPFNREEIQRRDIAEIENSAKGGPIAFADFFIINNGSVEDCLEQLENILVKTEEGMIEQ